MVFVGDHQVDTDDWTRLLLELTGLGVERTGALQVSRPHVGRELFGPPLAARDQGADAGEQHGLTQTRLGDKNDVATADDRVERHLLDVGVTENVLADSVFQGIQLTNQGILCRIRHSFHSFFMVE